MTEHLQQLLDVVTATWVFLVVLAVIAVAWVIYELRIRLTAANKFIDLVIAELNASKDTAPVNPGIVALPPRQEADHG